MDKLISFPFVQTDFHDRVLSAVEWYDPVLDRWSPGPSMTTERCTPACASSNGSLFAIGGNDSRNTHLSSVERLDARVSAIRSIDVALNNSLPFRLQEGAWTLVAPMSMARSWSASIALNNRLFVMGGGNGLRQVSSTCEVFEPRANRWQSFAPMPVER